MSELKISEERYREILAKHGTGDLVVFIDTASFREVFTENYIKQIRQSIGISILKESIIISFIFFSIPLFLISLGVFIVLGFSWWAFLIIPSCFIIWFVIHSKASIGKQHIISSIIFLMISFLLSFILLKDLNIFIKLSIVSFAFQIFLSKLLYYLSSKFAFSLLFKHYKFFAFFYETRLKEKSLVEMIWVETKSNFDNMISLKKKYGI